MVSRVPCPTNIGRRGIPLSPHNKKNPPFGGFFYCGIESSLPDKHPGGESLFLRTIKKIRLLVDFFYAI
jgi:hypothetical protein